MKNLEFSVRTSDGKEQKVKTDGSGSVKLRGIPPGYVDLWSDPTDAKLKTTLIERAIAPTPTSGQDSDDEPKDPARHLLRVVSLHVHEADTFKGMADECDLPWKALALFNFGTDEEKKVAKLLPGLVGCLSADDLDSTVFSDFDEPGLLFIPKPWKGTFHTSTPAVIRLAGVPREGGHVYSA